MMVRCPISATALGFLVLACASAEGQSPTNVTPERQVVTLRLNSAWTLPRLHDGGFNVIDRHENRVTVYATPKELQVLRLRGAPILGASREESKAAIEKPFGEYSTYASVTAELMAFADANPQLTRLESLGLSVQNREIWALLITDHPHLEEDEPEFKYVSTMHGDEPVGTELCLYFIDLLLGSYGKDDRITELVDETAIWIVPLMNPDGVELGIRSNAQGLDLNRSFPAYPDDFEGTLFGGEPLGAAGRPPEVAHIMEWTAANRFVLSANFHTGALVVNYPYDDDPPIPSGSDAPSPDDGLFEALSRRYAERNAPMAASPFFPDGITNGSAWFSITGGMQDWNYRYAGSFEVTVELSDVKRPPTNTLPALWDDNREAMLAYLEAVHWGLRGVVTGVHSGAPVSAAVRVDGHRQPVFTDPDVGDYHRVLLPGAYSVTVDAPGYIAYTIDGVTVEAGTASRLDVALHDGDVDGDGDVNAVDIATVVDHLLGRPCALACDVDGGGVSATDVQAVVNQALNR